VTGSGFGCTGRRPKPGSAVHGHSGPSLTRARNEAGDQVITDGQAGIRTVRASVEPSGTRPTLRQMKLPPERSLRKLSPAFIVAVMSLMLFAASAPAAPKPVAAYCSPTGDFCQGIFRAKGRLRADISTFSFRGRYRLCLRSRMYGNQCRTFRLRRTGHGIYRGRVTLSRHFRMRSAGRYSVLWRSPDGYRIGRKLRFRKR